MKAGVYKGPFKGLQGERALLRPHRLDDGMVLAQFNNTELEDPRTKALLGFHWHSFPAADFEVDKDADA